MKNIEKAINEATDSTLTFKHGCVIEKNGKIIGSGCNSERSRINGQNYPCCHAEAAAIHSVSFKKRTRRACNSTVNGWYEKRLLRGDNICSPCIGT